MSGPDPELLTRTRDELNRAMEPCAGGVDVESVHADGTVRLRLLGMCTGCSCRALTAARTVRPAFGSLPGVTAVEIAGTRISAQAEQRLARAFAHDPHTRCAAETTPEPESE